MNRSRPWAPVHLSPLSHLPSFGKLSPAAQLRYNQYFALGVSEIFCLFEEEFLVRILKNIEDFEDPRLKEAVVCFIDDERRHSALFQKLNSQAEPTLYPNGERFYFLKRQSIPHWFFGLMAAFPRTLLAWVWIAIFFEERTLMFAKEYLRAAVDKNAPPMDFHFIEAHRLHMIEEIRHVGMDVHLIAELHASASPWKRRLAAIMMKWAMPSFASPKKMSNLILDELEGDFPGEIQALAALRAELPLLAKTSSFQRVYFGPSAIERTAEIMARFPEFSGIWD